VHGNGFGPEHGNVSAGVHQTLRHAARPQGRHGAIDGKALGDTAQVDLHGSVSESHAVTR
jgi:hypothetical protein